MTELLEQLPDRERQIVFVARDVARSQNVPVYLVGGPVRDLLLGHVPMDLDFSLERGAEEFAREMGSRLEGTVAVYPQFMTCKIELPGLRPIDIATTRKETYEKPGALPVVAPAGLEEDLFRRDFTVNAIALDLVSGQLVDYFHGEEDLRRTQIRVLHEASFEDDPTRIYRAIRLAVRLGFAIEPQTRELMKAALDRNTTATVSRERLWRELFLAFHEAAAARVVAEFVDAGLVAPIIGRTGTPTDVGERLDAVQAEITDFPEADVALAFLAVLHSTTEPAAERFAGSGLTQKQIATIQDAVRELPHLLDRLRAATTERERLRACSSASDELLLLAATRDRSLEPIIARCRSFKHFESGVRGTDLGTAPGPHVGRALAETREALFLGEITRDEAPAFARRVAQEYLEKK